MSPQNGTTIDLTVTSSYAPITVYSTDDESVLTIASIYTAKPYSQPTTYNSSSSTSTPKTLSKSVISPGAELHSPLTSYFNIHNKIE